MNLPNFTAIVSIYQSKTRYVRSHSDNSQLLTVVPAVADQSVAASADLCVSNCVQTCQAQMGNYHACMQNCQARCQVAAPAGKRESG